MEEIKRPHDSFFKRLMKDMEVVRAFLRSFLPEDLSSAVDYSSVRMADTEKITRRYRKYFLDLSIECRLGDEDSIIYFVFEHKSYPDRLTHLQVLNYCTAVWEQNMRNGEPPIPIIPIVFYHGRRRFDIPIRFSDYFRVPRHLKKYLLDLRLVLFDTHEISDEQVVEATDNLHLAAAILAMKHIFDELKEMKPVFQHAVKLDRDRFMMILEYITLTKEVNEQELEEILKESGVETMPSLAQKWLEQGRREGIQQGMQQGLEQGMIQEAQEMVVEALRERFGAPSPRLVAGIKAVSQRETLKGLLKVAIRAEDLEEFKRELERILEDVE